MGLARRGVQEGDVVGLAMGPEVAYVIAYLAAAKMGAICAGVNDRLSPSDRAGILEVAAAKIVLSDASECVELEVAGEAPGQLSGDTNRAVAIVFTSGTTGVPRGALFRNRQLAAITATDVGENWGSGGRNFNGTPFAHLGFMTKLPGHLRRGGTTFLLDRWRADAALDLVATHQMTSIGGVPTQLAMMISSPRFDELDLSCLRAIITGGGPLTPGLASEIRSRFGAALATRYSCTEAGLGCGTALDDPHEDAVISVGRPLPGVEIQLVDKVGEVGEVCLRSAAVMSEYWRDPTATAAAFTSDGFVRTGDLGWLDDLGRLRLVGRAKEMYVRGGENVYPVEVEAALSTHPDIAAIAVVPRGDRVMGEIGVAVIVPVTGAGAPTLEDLRRFGRGKLSGYKLPEAMLVVTELPLTPNEKIDRGVLRSIVDPASP